MSSFKFKLGYLLSFLISVTAFTEAFAQGRVFYDGFESGNTNLWQKDGSRNPCLVVSSATDGVLGPYAGTKMLRCSDNGVVTWSDPAAFETLVLANVPYTKEILFRVRLRADQNLEKSGSSPKKILRIYNWNGVQSTYNDIFESFYPGSGLVNQIIAGGQQLSTYWGGTSGDSSTSTTAWHKIEYYINTSGIVKIWHDGVLVKNESGLNTSAAKFLPFYITSNWSDPHDAVNHIYFDEFEAYSDSGSGGIGSMADASIRSSDSNPVPPPPSDTQAAILSAGSPSGSLAAGTTTATLSVATNENASCKYSLSANTSFSAMASSLSGTALSHTASLSGLVSGSSYNYYVRCQDAAGNINSSDYVISFSVAAIVPPPTTPPASTQSVTNLQLVNADTGAVIQNLASGDVLNLATLPTRNLNIAAITSPSTVGSVKFAFDGNNSFRIESMAPYALYADDNGKFYAFTPSLGSHTISATPYTLSGATGSAGTVKSLSFSVIDQAPVPQLSVAQLALINADTGAVIKNLASGDVLNLATLPSKNLNIAAITSPTTVGSVKFAFDGNSSFRIESVAPYALYADDNGKYYAFTPSLGSHSVSATAYSLSGATGTAGVTKTINFSVINQK